MHQRVEALGRGLSIAALVSGAGWAHGAGVAVDDSGTSYNGQAGSNSALVARAGAVAVAYTLDDESFGPTPTSVDLRYAWLDQSGWHRTTVDGLLTGSYVGQEPALARSSTGEDHIVYVSEVGISWAHGTGTSWTLEPAPVAGTSVPTRLSLVLDALDRPVLTYLEKLDDNDRALRFSRWNGSAWTLDGASVIDTNVYSDTTQPQNSALALDTLGRPHVVYAKGGLVKHAVLDTGVWTIENVGAGADASIAIGTDGTVRCAYANASTIVYATRGTNAWTSESVGTGVYTPSLIAGVTLALDTLGRPVIACSMTASGDIFVMTRRGGAWRCVRADGDGLAGGALSLGREGLGLGVDSAGSAWVSYQARTDNPDTTWRADLRVAHVTSFPCNRADITDGSGTGEPDGTLSGSDVVAFFQAFFGPTLAGRAPGIPANRADLTDGSGAGAADGALTGSDVLKFFTEFFSGCAG